MATSDLLKAKLAIIRARAVSTLQKAVRHYPAGDPEGRGGQFMPLEAVAVVGPQRDVPPPPDISHWNQEHSHVRAAHRRMATLRQLAKEGRLGDLRAFSTTRSHGYYRVVDDYRNTLLQHLEPAARLQRLRGTLPPAPNITGRNMANTALVGARNHVERLENIALTSPNPRESLLNYQVGSGNRQTNTYLRQAHDYHQALIAHYSQGEEAAAQVARTAAATASTASTAGATAAQGFVPEQGLNEYFNQSTDAIVNRPGTPLNVAYHRYLNAYHNMGLAQRRMHAAPTLILGMDPDFNFEARAQMQAVLRRRAKHRPLEFTDAHRLELDLFDEAIRINQAQDQYAAMHGVWVAPKTTDDATADVISAWQAVNSFRPATGPTVDHYLDDIPARSDGIFRQLDEMPSPASVVQSFQTYRLVKPNEGNVRAWRLFVNQVSHGTPATFRQQAAVNYFVALGALEHRNTISEYFSAAANRFHALRGYGYDFDSSWPPFLDRLTPFGDFNGFYHRLRRVGPNMLETLTSELEATIASGNAGNPIFINILGALKAEKAYRDGRQSIADGLRIAANARQGRRSSLRVSDLGFLNAAPSAGATAAPIQATVRAVQETAAFTAPRPRSSAPAAPAAPSSMPFLRRDRLEEFYGNSSDSNLFPNSTANETPFPFRPSTSWSWGTGEKRASSSIFDVYIRANPEDGELFSGRHGRAQATVAELALVPEIAANPAGQAPQQLGFIPRPNVPLSARIQNDGINHSGRLIEYPTTFHRAYARAYLAQDSGLQSRARHYQEGTWIPKTPEALARIAEERRVAEENIRARLRETIEGETRRRAEIPETWLPRSTVGANVRRVNVGMPSRPNELPTSAFQTKESIETLSKRMIADYGGTTQFNVNASISQSSASISWEGSDGTSISRNFRPDGNGGIEVYHSYFRAGSQGDGAGKRFFRVAFGEYKAMGVTRVKVSANINVGGYAWARYGFLPDRHGWSHLAQTALNAARRLKTNRQITEKTFAKIAEIVRDSDPKGLWKLADLEENGVSVGKKLLLGTSWSGTINLNDREQMKRFTAYVARAD